MTLIAPPTATSPFVLELLEHPLTIVESSAGEPAAPPTPCPQCGSGTLTKRTGKYGPFLGCTTFPACRYTTSLERQPS